MKTSSLLFGLMLSASSLFALAEKPFSPVCSEQELKKVLSTDTIKVSGDAKFETYGSKSSIKIDNKTDTFSMWTISIASPAGRSHAIGLMGKKADHSNFGYSKSYKVFDPKGSKEKVLSVFAYSCKGDTIYAEKYPNAQWKHKEIKIKK